MRGKRLKGCTARIVRIIRHLESGITARLRLFELVRVPVRRAVLYVRVNMERLRRAGLFRDAEFEGCSSFDYAFVPKSTKEMVEKRLCFSLLIAFQRAREGDELRERELEFSRGHG